MHRILKYADADKTTTTEQDDAEDEADNGHPEATETAQEANTNTVDDATVTELADEKKQALDAPCENEEKEAGANDTNESKQDENAQASDETANEQQNVDGILTDNGN